MKSINRVIAIQCCVKPEGAEQVYFGKVDNKLISEAVSKKITLMLASNPVSNPSEFMIMIQK